MKRLIAAVAVLISGGLSPASVDAQTSASPSPDFGAAPSGEVPILFNDKHLYAKPDGLRSGRVLAALVRGDTVLIPLRSMFEEMGATVSYDAASRTADVSKPGAAVKVTIGRPEVIINGETRPLEAAPIVYDGSVMVPIRVISEGLGAYVQWVPDRRIVVVRFATAPVPTPPPAPTQAPIPEPTAPPIAPTPAAHPKPAVHRVQEHFIVGDYDFSNRLVSEFGNGNAHGTASYSGRIGTEFQLGKLQLMTETVADRYSFFHQPGNVRTIGGAGSTFVKGFDAVDRDLSARLGIRILKPRVYLAVSYLWRSGNYGYPIQHGVGFGIERLPNLDRPLSFFSSFYLYPNVSGQFAAPNGLNQLAYKVTKQEAGLAYSFPRLGIFIEAGYQSYRSYAKSLAPSDVTHSGFFGGVGIKF